MNPDKEYIIDELYERINSSPFLIVVDYATVTVPEFEELRKRLASNEAECHVAKNTYIKHALTKAELPEIGEHLIGQTAFITGEQDVSAAAKTLKNFAKEFKRPEVKVGILDGEVMTGAQLKALADLPSREELLAKLLAVINAPASKLVRTLNEPASALARVLAAKKED